MIAQSEFWAIQTGLCFANTPIFKIKNIQQDRILFNLPQGKKIVATSSKLERVLKVFDFESQPQSIEHYILNQNEYILGGCHNGVIKGYNFNNVEDQFELVEQNKPELENYINDIKLIGQKRIVNCFNNGSIAIWDLQKRELLHKISNVHKRFTYKLRIYDQMLYSCGNDGNAVLTDLQKCKVVKYFKHNNPVWCIHAISRNQLATVGLLHSVMLWDVRMSKIAQYCPLVGSQTSYVTKFNDWNLVLGDEKQLVKCNLRMLKREILSNNSMSVSAEGIDLTQDGGVVCGRGRQILVFRNSEKLQDQKISCDLTFGINPNIIKQGQQLTGQRSTYLDIDNFYQYMLEDGIEDDIENDIDNFQFDNDANDDEFIDQNY